MKIQPLFLSVCVVFAVSVSLPGRMVAEDGLQMSTFSVDITPIPGRPVGQGFIPVLQTAEHPLLARGILLKDANTACVLCSLDLMEVHNDTYDFLRQQIARAAGVRESDVALQCLHQHTAPAIDIAALRLERREDDSRLIATVEYATQIAEKISAAIQRSVHEWQPVTHIGTGMATVDRVASNRRLELPDGTIQGRSSSTKSSPHLRQLPEGLIDPWVRTVSLCNENDVICYLHYYASHPQSFYGDGRATYDVPGIIRDRMEQQTGAFQLYFTGCGGDVAFGKYNDGSQKARAEITDRLQAGIEQSIATTKKQAVKSMTWSVTGMRFPLRTDKAFSEAENQKILDDPKASEGQRRKAAIAIAWIHRVRSEKEIELSCLTVGSAKILHLPGEPFVQFQLAAQQMQPNQFVCVAGYGDCGMGYIGGDHIYSDRGGYEQTYAFAGPCEALFLNTIRDLLDGNSEP